MTRVGGSGPETVIGAGAPPAVKAMDVVLRDAGANPAAVAEVVRSMTGREPAAAKELVAQAPCAVRTRIAPALAEALRAKLVAAGASVEVREHGAAPEAPELCDVVLQGVGGRKIDVVRAVRIVTGLGLREAVELVEETPSVIKRKIDRAAAETIVHELVEAGAKAELRAHDATTPEPPVRASEPVSVPSAVAGPPAGEFAVILQHCGPNKISVIKAIRSVTGLGLKDSKDLAESSGVPVKQDIGEEEAEAIRRELAEAGALVEIRGPHGAPAAAPAQQTTAGAFDLVLHDCGAGKIPVIKLIRELTGLGLKEAKDMAESRGVTVKEGLGRAEAAKIERQFVEAGAVVELRSRGGEVATDDEAAQVELFLRSCGPNKISVIKEVRALTNFGLKESKDLVEAAPCVIMREVDREEAIAAQRRFIEAGAVVELR